MANDNSPHHSDDEDEFLDAREEQDEEGGGGVGGMGGAGTMDLQRSMEEAELAMKYFFNNKFCEARELMTKWAASSMYHAMGESVFAFLTAALTFEREPMREAAVKLKQCLALCEANRSKRTMRNMRTARAYTELQAHAELCHSEMLLLKAVLTFMEDEELLSLIRGSLRIKQCYNGYKECREIGRTSENKWVSKYHFDTGVHLGIGAFNLMISLLPARIIKLLEFVGFSGDKSQGLAQLSAGAELTAGMRHILCVVTLLTYHLFICYVVTDQPGDLRLCERLVARQLQAYPRGAFFMFFKARLEYMKGDLELASEWYDKSRKSQEVWPQFHHVCFWEMLWIHCTKREWREALVYCDRLLESSRWSRTVYSYQKAAVMLMMRDELDEEQRGECDRLMRGAAAYKQRIAGKSLPMEKFVIRRCDKYAARDGRLLLPAVELMYLWNMFRVFENNLTQGDKMLRYIEECDAGGGECGADADDKALLLLLKGAALRHLGAHYQAKSCLDALISLKKQIKEDAHLVPYAIVEMGLLFHKMGDKTKAIAALEDARKNYSGYSLESRLHFRIHTALSSFKSCQL